jgi:hypothetical protein
MVRGAQLEGGGNYATLMAPFKGIKDLGAAGTLGWRKMAVRDNQDAATKVQQLRADGERMGGNEDAACQRDWHNLSHRKGDTDNHGINAQPCASCALPSLGTPYQALMQRLTGRSRR